MARAPSPLLSLILVALGCGGTGPWVDTEVLLQVDEDATSCPPASEVETSALFNPGWCGTIVRAVTGEGELRTDEDFGEGGLFPAVCAYPATARNANEGCVVGRPFGGDAAAVAGLPDGEHAGWRAMARGEHASVAAFAQLTLDLMALGAPLALLAEVAAAQADEVRHAALACDRAGVTADFAPFPFAGPITPCADPVAVAVAAVREGCLGETVSAWVAARDAAQAAGEDRAVLEAVAADEARHAALSWKIVAWLLRTHPEVRGPVVAALRAPVAVGSPFGAVTPAEVQAVLADVLAPAAAALLAA
jgi:hypothetical protein